MTSVMRPRRIVALLAAYAVALQALLLPLTVAAGAAPAASLCTSVASNGTQSPAGHAIGCPCAAGCGMQCCVGALAGPPQIFALVAPSSAGERLTQPAAAPKAFHAQRSPQLARAPPAA